MTSEKHELFDINPVVVLQFLTIEERDRLLQYFQTNEKESGKLRGAGNKISDQQNDQPRPEYIRNNTVCWMNRSEDTSWIYEKISALLTAINSQKYHFAIDTIQTIQLAEYTAGGNDESGQFYKPHIDICMTGWINTQRKLSLTIQLTPPENYEGGNLLLFGDKNDLILNQANYSKNIQQRREFLTAIIFPSFLEHEVTPVTKGTRHSLVAWMEGPNWK